jgi:hypothetical protein
LARISLFNVALPYTAITTGRVPTSRNGKSTVKLRTATTTTPPDTTIVGLGMLHPESVHVGVVPEESRVAAHEMVRSLMVLVFAMAAGSKLAVTA